MVSGYEHPATQWIYPEDTRSALMRLVDRLIFGRRETPNEPLLLAGPGLDRMQQGEAEIRYRPQTVNYNQMMRYNPYVAQAFADNRISGREAQYIINQGNVPSWSGY